jgi:hypothetical protein
LILFTLESVSKRVAGVTCAKHHHPEIMAFLVKHLSSLLQSTYLLLQQHFDGVDRQLETRLTLLLLSRALEGLAHRRVAI